MNSLLQNLTICTVHTIYDNLTLENIDMFSKNHKYLRRKAYQTHMTSISKFGLTLRNDI